MKTICIINNKGGVGKTATTATIGHMMATVHNKRTLLIDLDPQGNTSAMFSETDFFDLFANIMNGTPNANKEKSVEDILLNPNMDVHEVIRHTNYENLDIIPAFLTLSEVEELLKSNIKTPQQFKLKTALQQIQDEYDYCIIDCSPSINLLNINGLVASDEIYIPLRCDGASCVGLAITMNLVRMVQTYNPTLKIMGCFLTQYGSRKQVSKTVYELLVSTLGKDMVIPIKIGVTKLLEENSFTQEPLLVADSGKNKSSVTEAYLNLTEYMIAPNKTAFLEELTRRGVL